MEYGAPQRLSGKEAACNAGDVGSIHGLGRSSGEGNGQEDILEKEMATHSSILAWKITWMEKPGRLQSMGRKESDTTEQLHYRELWASLVVQIVKNPPAMQETQVLYLDQENPLEKGMATHSCMLASKIS